MFSQKLPYITSDTPGVGGVLKSKPENFIVEEVPSFEPIGKGSHLYMSITKKGITTRDLQKRIAETLDKRIHDVGLAGLKDKEALTTQTFSVNLGLIQETEIPKMIETLECELSIKVNWFKRHPKKLRRGHLTGNNFRIILSEINESPEKSIKKCNQIIKKLNIMGLPNFYGYQRISQSLDNVRKGYRLLIERKTASNLWLHRLLISSFQSFLCNEYLVSRIRNGMYNRLYIGDIAQRHDTGGVFKVTNLDQEQKRFTDNKISFTAPIYGYNIEKATGLTGILEDEILERYGLDEKLFRLNRVKGTRRIGRVFPKINLEPHEEGIRFDFFLPSGSYATILMREFMKAE